MKYTRWVVAFAMICGASHAGQALAESLTLPDADSLGLSDQTKNYAFSGRAGDAADCQGTNACPNSAISPDRTSIVVTHDGASGKLLAIAITSSAAFPSGWNNLFVNTDSMGSLSDVRSWDYFAHSGGVNAAGTVETGENAPGDNLYQVLDSPNLTEDTGPNQDGRADRANAINARYFGKMGVNAFVGSTDAVRVKTSTNSDPLAFDSAKLSAPIYSGGSPYWANDNDANDMLLVAGANDANDTGDVKKPETSTVVLVGMGTIAAMVLAGMGIAALAGKKK